ncbi:uncharacterized protein LOC112184218 isoform X2 [Rosa chinensis]|uniref:uncharacterized protein LOC112184218 isoform X2 n=1 Tax=Rosa chinensis TaxID=74649 RepID=UPI001AD932FD|nr:uncharacterized protein LOC112184218 isoform X2 [Rosa chinensis]
MSVVINSVTKAANRHDMLCDDAVSHLNSSSPGCRGSNERGARLRTYRRRETSALIKQQVLLVRHNLDVVHSEKNICYGILGSLLKLKGKSKDGLKSRKDLEAMQIRQDLHPKVRGEKFLFFLVIGKKIYLACFVRNYVSEL